jgi:DNA helicase-2/ATP-dependent DNA helicase PcrA
MMISRFFVSYSSRVRVDQAECIVRYNALSRTIESTLQKDSIPNKIVGGHKFFERLEVKDLLAYLQLAENPGFNVS